VMLLFVVIFSMAQTNDACKYIKVLASDSLQGRQTGTLGAEMAASYIRNAFVADNLELLFDNGYQYLDVVTGAELGKKNYFEFNKQKFAPETDYIPYSFSQDTVISAGVVFVGYGFSISNDSMKWDDYKNVDVKNKWVMVLRGTPDKYKTKLSNFSADRNKMLAAKDHGAAGIILVSKDGKGKESGLVALSLEKTKSRSGICVINITPATADKILSSGKQTIAALEPKSTEASNTISFELKGTVNAAVEIVAKKVKSANVVARLMSTQKTENYIVIGAHYDHLGMGGHGSGSRKPDTVAVHNGADDNASGTASVMAMADRFSKTILTGNYNIIFVAFTGEEEGLLGSAWFVKHLPVDKKKIKLMINYDMVGRLNAKHSLTVGGVGTFADAEKVLKQNNDSTKLKLSLSKEGFGPSDHASFYNDSIPVLYFNTGVHGDYHTPEDDFDKINCAGVNVIGDYTAKVAEDLMKNTYNLAFMEAGSKKQGSQREGMKVTLGIMPDFAEQDVKGLGVAAVTPDGPAFRGGVLKGDVIVAINGKPINDIYDYMERLKSINPGQTITIDVMRTGKKEVLLIQL
ncbi:MAG: M28 family peptidase, partial [Eubacteriales bacterium]